MVALLTVFNSWALLETRRLVQVFPEPLQKLWNNWELRVLVLVSLTLQVCLLHFGSRRRYSVSTWWGALLWLSYLGADSVATVALGVISNNQGNSCNCNDSQTQNELIAFWAAFLLLHLGGQDTITAYAVQDNELWLRHFLGLVVQSVVALYIFLLSWEASWLSFLSIPMFVAGFIKYAERIYVLKAANNPNPLIGLPMSGRSAIFCTPNRSLKSSDEDSDESNIGAKKMGCISIGAKKWDAFLLFKVFRYRFLDRRPGVYISDFGLSSYFLDFQTAWETIEDELGYFYDVYYTKAPLFFTAWGFLFRIVCFTSIVSVFVLFVIIERHKHPQIDLVITFLLLIGAVLVEIYAIILHCGTDWPLCGSDWTQNTQGRLIKHVTNVRIGFAKMTSKQKWSKSMGQLSLLGLYFEDKCPQNGRGTPKLFANFWERALNQMLPRLDIRLKMLFYRTNKHVTDDLKKLVHFVLKGKLRNVLDGCNIRGGRPNSMEDYQNIIVWHIATDLLFDKDFDKGTSDNNRILSKVVSDYLMYILAMTPFEFLTGNGKLCFESWCRWFDGYCHQSDVFRLSKEQVWKKIIAYFGTCIVDIGWQSKSALGVEFSDSMVSLAMAIAENVTLDAGMWEKLSEFWVGNLIYVASLSKGYYHAQQLRKGGGNF